jgi:hypothetical protein
MVADGGFDRVFAVDVGAARGGSRGVEEALRLELARRSRSRLGESLTSIEPITPEDARATSFPDLFLDRRRWPDLMRRGYSSAVEALAPFARRRRRSAGSAGRNA